MSRRRASAARAWAWAASSSKPGDTLILECLATWLTSRPTRFAGTPAFAHALLLLAEVADTMYHVREQVQVRWYPPDSYVVEQGEAAAELFLILSGEAEVRQESDSRREQLRRLEGEFLGELGVASRRGRSADGLPAPASPAWSCLRQRQPSALAG